MVSKSKQHRLLENDKKIIKVCPSCQNEFTDVSKYGSSVYCSQQCRSREQYRRQIAKDKNVPAEEVVIEVRKTKKKKTNIDRIQEINAKAKEKGLSYGMYILMYGNGDKK